MHILSSGLFIEFDDYSFEIVKSKIDVNSLFFKKTFYTCGFNSLGTWQID